MNCKIVANEKDEWMSALNGSEIVTVLYRYNAFEIREIQLPLLSLNVSFCEKINK